MVVGLGMDLVEVERIHAALERHRQRFLSRCFTPAEQAYCTGRGLQCHESLAARYAAKEAAWKALGVPPGLRWVEMEVAAAQTGRSPQMMFHGRAAHAAAQLGVQRSLVSLSHAGGVAAAVVVLEK